MKRLAILFLVLLAAGCAPVEEEGSLSGIAISDKDPQYWQYDGEASLLLGGSDEDNLFQMPGLEAQLDLLASVGGNYVRNTMSSRDSGNVWAFARDPESGLYDLNTWNPVYWDRFERLLELTAERRIVVQVELWATFDFYRDNWDVNPFNPKNNINYNAQRTDLPLEVPTHPTHCDNPFFWSVPSQHNNMPLLQYQQAFVDKVLSHSLAYGHVLYCIDNETSVTSDWGAFWSVYLQKKAAELGKKVQVTEMWDPWDLNHISHRESFDHPELYAFVEISQNNHQRGEAQWDNGLAQIEKLKNSGMLRPVNNVKTYGSDRGRHGGGTQNGIQSFIRSALFGSAAVRFHRPPSGLGLGDTARLIIKGLREATDRMDFFSARPGNELLRERETNEAYCRALPGKDYLVYFPDKGSVELNVTKMGSAWKVDRLDMLSSDWTEAEGTPQEGWLRLESPGPHFIFLVKSN